MLTRIGPGHMPVIDHPMPNSHSACNVPAMKRFQLDRDTTPENRPTPLFDQPDSRRTHAYSHGEDAVELKLREQEHPLNEAVVGGTGAAQDEPEDGAEHQIESSH